MSTVLQEYGNLKERATQVLKALFLAADIDGDGNLTTEEFGDVVRLADATLSHQCVCRVLPAVCSFVSSLSMLHATVVVVYTQGCD